MHCPESMRKHLAENIYFEMSHAQPWGKVLLETAVEILGADHIVYGSSSPVKTISSAMPSRIPSILIPESQMQSLLLQTASRKKQPGICTPFNPA